MSDEWRTNFTMPVIRLRYSSSKLHLPDPRSEEPKPICSLTGGTQREYIVYELEDIQPFKDKCTACFSPFDRTVNHDRGSQKQTDDEQAKLNDF